MASWDSSESQGGVESFRTSPEAESLSRSHYHTGVYCRRLETHAPNIALGAQGSAQVARAPDSGR